MERFCTFRAKLILVITCAPDSKSFNYRGDEMSVIKIVAIALNIAGLLGLV